MAKKGAEEHRREVPAQLGAGQGEDRDGEGAEKRRHKGPVTSGFPASAAEFSGLQAQNFQLSSELAKLKGKRMEEQRSTYKTVELGAESREELANIQEQSSTGKRF